MTIDWQKLYRERQKVAKQFGDIWSLPVSSRYHRVVATQGHAGVSVLEVGAGNRSFKNKLTDYWGELEYKSCDIDPTFDHDFANIESVDGTYDLICAFELIEHLTLSQAKDMVTRMFDLVKPGGKVALTTPNIYYPPGFLRDATHLTPFCYDELGGLLALAGFRVTSIHRLYHDSLIKKFIRRVLFYPVFRIIGIDFAKQIIVVAEKPA
jgi:SAM-dependent methyltransferase